MDPLLESDRELAQSLTPKEKFAQAVELARMGYRLKRINLRARHPTASEVEIDQMLAAWLAGDD